jgi:hypothetical protein
MGGHTCSHACPSMLQGVAGPASMGGGVAVVVRRGAAKGGHRSCKPMAPRAAMGGRQCCQCRPLVLQTLTDGATYGVCCAASGMRRRYHPCPAVLPAMACGAAIRWGH